MNMRDLKHDIGQLLIIGFDATEMSPRLASLLTKIQPAGVILFARNITAANQTHRLLRECQKCLAPPLFTCVDLEGGQVDRFRDVFGPTPSAADVFSTGDRKLFRKHGRHDRRELPRSRLQCGFRSRAGPGVRDFEISHGIPRRIS